MCNRFGWLAAIVVVALLASNKEAKPNPILPPPPHVIDSVPKTIPPKDDPKPDATSVLLDRLETILRKLDITSLETLANKLESVDFTKLKSMVDLLNRYGQQIEISHEPASNSTQERLSRFEQKLDELAAKHIANTSEPDGAVIDAEANQGAKTTCMCNGSDRNNCLCLKAGVECHCTAGVGSVWKKTTQKASTSSSRPAETASSNGFPVRIAGQWMYWNVDGIEWHNGGTGIQEGLVYGNRFTYRGGMMQDSVSRSIVMSPLPSLSQPANQNGRWRKVCHNGYCTWELVPN